MLILFKICCCIFIVNAKHTYNATSRKETQLRVLGGHEVTTDEYSFVIILSFFWSMQMFRMCTGFMITEEWGLTAGHCECHSCYVWYSNFTESPITTQLLSQVSEIIRHPSYRCLSTDGGTVDLIVDNDISLFRVYHKIEMKSYARLLSVDGASIIGLPVTYVGGGYTNIKNSPDDALKPLQYGEGAVINCDVEMRSKSKYAICISPKCSERLTRPWYGDSGGPLMYDGKVIGICSYGIESDVIARAGYTPIHPYIDWIYDVMHSQE